MFQRGGTTRRISQLVTCSCFQTDLIRQANRVHWRTGEQKQLAQKLIFSRAAAQLAERPKWIIVSPPPKHDQKRTCLSARKSIKSWSQGISWIWMWAALQVFESVVTWTNHDIKNRHEYVSTLMEHVRLPLLSQVTKDLNCDQNRLTLVFTDSFVKKLERLEENLFCVLTSIGCLCVSGILSSESGGGTPCQKQFTVQRLSDWSNEIPPTQRWPTRDVQNSKNQSKNANRFTKSECCNWWNLWKDIRFEVTALANEQISTPPVDKCWNSFDTGITSYWRTSAQSDSKCRMFWLQRREVDSIGRHAISSVQMWCGLDYEWRSEFSEWPWSLVLARHICTANSRCRCVRNEWFGVCGWWI